MGVMQAAGLSMQWLRNNFYPGDSEYAQINRRRARKRRSGRTGSFTSPI